MSANRCVLCDKNWKPTARFAVCPICGGTTYLAPHLEPTASTDTPEERAEQNRKDFASFLAMRERDLEKEFSLIIGKSFSVNEISKLKRYADDQVDQMQRRAEAQPPEAYQSS